jgi:hypothetical protein
LRTPLLAFRRPETTGRPPTAAATPSSLALDEELDAEIVRLEMGG